MTPPPPPPAPTTVITEDDQHVVEVTYLPEPIVSVVPQPDAIVEITSTGMQGPPGVTSEVYPFYFRGPLLVSTGAYPIFLSSYYTLGDCDLSLLVPPTGSPAVVQLVVNSVPVATATFTPGLNHVVIPASTSVNLYPGDVMSVDITAIGSGYPGMNLGAVVRLTRRN